MPENDESDMVTIRPALLNAVKRYMEVRSADFSSVLNAALLEFFERREFPIEELEFPRNIARLQQEFDDQEAVRREIKRLLMKTPSEVLLQRRTMLYHRLLELFYRINDAPYKKLHRIQREWRRNNLQDTEDILTDRGVEMPDIFYSADEYNRMLSEDAGQ